jgi:hypothetical protein
MAERIVAHIKGAPVDSTTGRPPPSKLASARGLSGSLLYLQGTAGNQAVGRLLSTPRPLVQRVPAGITAQPLVQSAPGQPQALESQPPSAIAFTGAGEGSGPKSGTKPQGAAPSEEQPTPGCNPGPGLLNSNCGAYLRNTWWLPLAYVNNATCACQETPNLPTANCVRKVLQDRLAATPTSLKWLAASEKPLEANPATYLAYWAFVQAFLTPRIHDDHKTAYKTCCCPSGPASRLAWVGVTSVPLPCPVVGKSILKFGSCHGTPGKW